MLQAPSSIGTLSSRSRRRREPRRGRRPAPSACDLSARLSLEARRTGSRRPLPEDDARPAARHVRAVARPPGGREARRPADASARSLAAVRRAAPVDAVADDEVGYLRAVFPALKPAVPATLDAHQQAHLLARRLRRDRGGSRALCSSSTTSGRVRPESGPYQPLASDARRGLRDLGQGRATRRSRRSCSSGDAWPLAGAAARLGPDGRGPRSEPEGPRGPARIRVLGRDAAPARPVARRSGSPGLAPGRARARDRGPPRAARRRGSPAPRCRRAARRRRTGTRSSETWSPAAKSATSARSPRPPRTRSRSGAGSSRGAWSAG